MIKETDASKNDERRVKNKPNPLTHKRKGETRTMYNQSTKHWKLGALFVISLMLVAGLFSNTASAQWSQITVAPATVLATDTVDVTITYEVTAPEIGLAADNVIVLALPAGWNAAYGTDFGLTAAEIDDDNAAAITTATPVIETDGSTTRVRVLNPNKTSYATWTATLSAGLELASTPTVGGSFTVTRKTNNTTANMMMGNAVAITYHNVTVPAAAGDTPFAATDTVVDANSVDVPDPVDATVARTVLESLGETTDTAGNVKVSPASVSAEGMVDLTVKYTATKHLAERNSKATATEDLDSTYGRIQITLPADWGPAGTIYEKRQSDPDATYLSLVPSGGVSLRKDDGKANDANGNPFALTVGGTQATGWIIWIDVDRMTSRQHATLTIKNLEGPVLGETRGTRYGDILAEDGMKTFQVEVHSEHYVTPALRNAAITTALNAPTIPPRTFEPKVVAESEEQPTITLTRKTQGELTIAPDKVTAGKKEDFTITYKATEALEAGEAIEIRLPGWAVPTAYQLKVNGSTADVSAATIGVLEAEMPHVYLRGSSRLTETGISVIDDVGTAATVGAVNTDGWFVRIVLGKALSRNSTVILNYNKAAVQRHLTSDEYPVLIEAFSGPSLTVSSLPQFPVKEQKKITVELAGDGSGEVTFTFAGTPVAALTADNHNTEASIPAGIVKDDARSLVLTYMPVGNMGKGGFEFRMPSGWSAEDILTSGDTKTTPAEGEVKAGTTVTSILPEYFGETNGYALEITLVDITVPNSHGSKGFVAKSKREGGTFKQLASKPAAFVGNAMPANDIVAVEITPAAAYQNQDSVDFEITLTANGPMHDSEIQITLPDGLANLQTDKPADPNHVRKVSASVSGVEVIADPDQSNEGIILIKTAKLNTGGKIKVRYDNVDLADVDPDPSGDPATLADEGFRVGTKTRGDFTALDYYGIWKDDGTRSIVGGLIRTVAGSGTMVVEPATVEQGSRNKNFKLTFTAATDFSKLNLVINAPSVIETELQEAKSSDDGYVSTSTSKFHTDIEAVDRLVISGSTITWTGVTLKRGEKFITNISRLDLLEDTGNFPWETTLADVLLPSANNEPLVVVGTMEDDVVFEVVDESDISDSNPSYPASSMQSIRFKFTTRNTAIQPGGRLWFTVPVGWSLPSLTDKAKKATVGILAYNDDGDEIFPTKLPDTKDSTAGEKMVLSVSGRSVILSIGAKGGLAEDGSVTIRYGTHGTDDLTKFPVQISSSAKGTADNDEDGLAIRGRFRVSDEFRQRDAGTIWVDVANAVDGSGTATIDPASVRAGSTKNLMTVAFTGEGTMDGGVVRLTIADDWGAMQDEDPLLRNYVEVAVSGTGAVLTDYEIVDNGLAVVANLTTFGKGNKVTFTYGGGTGARDSRGATAQADIGEATFMIESMGSSDGDFVDIREDDKADSVNPLTIEVKGAESGSGEGVVEIVKNKSGEGLYDGATDVDEAMMQVHAGDDSTYLVFTYTPSQTIAEGQLRFTVPGTWTPPQRDGTGEPGYTYLEEIGGAVISNEDYSKGYVTADISLTLEDEIKIHYGWYDTENGGAEAPSAVPTGGYSQFAIAVKGTLDDTAQDGFENIDGEDLVVRVRVQRSGGGMAEVSPMTVNAGDIMSAITVTYTADGQVDDGQLKLTIPANWDAPTMDNVTIVGGGSNTAARFGGAHTVAELTALALVADDDVDLGAMDVLVDNVMLAAGSTVVFTYTSAIAQGTAGSAAFAVAIDSGDGPDTGPKAVGGMTTVMVDEAAPGSGMAMATTDGIVLPGSTENILTFTYTVAGEASFPADVRVAVTDDWTSVVSSNYTVAHKRAGITHLDMVEKKDPIDGAMVARVVSGETVMAGDEIIFELMDVTAPADAGAYPFVVTFRNQAIAANPMVIVQSAEASKLTIKAPVSVVGDAGAVPVGISIMIQDAVGGEAAVADDVTVNLLTTNSSTGSFTSDGEAATMVTIPAGMSSAMVYYSDTRVGSTATIVVSDGAGALDSATTSILVTTSVDIVDTITVSPAMAMAGAVMITVTGTPGKTGTAAVFSVGKFVTNASLTESATSPGTYTGTVTVVSDLQDGMHDVMATLGKASKTEVGALTIDTMMPSITLTAPAADTTVANGGSVTITATAGDGTGSGIASVMADVSMLDSTQTDVALTTIGTDGSYSAAVAISDDNEAVNGSKTITVTAMDAAGNSAMAEAMVMLDNKMSFTSMIPAGTSLFHVPLDVNGLDTVGDLKTMIGAAVTLAITYDSATGSWNSRSDDVAITSTLGIILSMSAEATVTFDGDTWDGGTSTISLSAGANLIGLPVNDPRVTNVSDIAGLFAANIVSTVVVSTDDGFKSVGAAGDAGDGPVMGDAAYLVTAAPPGGNAVLIGDGWTYSAMAAAPVALAGYSVEGQTAVLDVQGAVVDEITGLAREGFRVKVKNLSTKAALSSVSSVEAADGYNMTFVDLKAGNAARIGDVLEISADSPNPLIGVQQVRHIVTVDDVKNSTIQLEELIAYEIPAETELLRNYPNPFNPETWIPYRLAEDADVSLTIYDAYGALVRSIDIGHQTAAVYDTKAKAIHWDGRNQFGEQVASGLYFYHLSAGDDFSATRRMVILK